MRSLISAAVALAVAGIGALLLEGTVATVVAIALLRSSSVLLVAAPFYEVGRSEDRERAAAARRRGPRR